MSKKVKEIKAPKKRHRGLKIFLIILVIIIVLPIAFVFIAFFDPTTKKVSASAIHYENAVSQAISKGFAGLTDTKDPRIELYIDKEMFDGIMVSACDAINQKKWIPKMYCYINGNNYTFVMDAQAAFFKTRLLIKTKLDKQEDTLIFKITGFTLGRLPIPTNWVSGIVGNFIKEDMLNAAFDKIGFHFHSDLKKMQLTYDRNQFKDDVYNYLIKSGGDNEFLKVLLGIFGNKDVLTTDYKDGVTAGFHLSPLMLPTSQEEGKYLKKAPLDFQNLDKHKEEIIDLLNNHDLPEGKVADVFKYLIRGGNSVPTDIGEDAENDLKTYVEKDNLVEYEGAVVKVNGEQKKFQEYVGTSTIIDNIFTYTPTGNPPTNISLTFQLPSDDLNTILAQKLDGIIGTTIPITFKNEDKWDFEYIFVDNIYTGFQQESADKVEFVIYLQLNIGGIPVTLSIGTHNIQFLCNQDQDAKVGYITFDLEDAYFGSIKIEDKELIEGILDLIPATGDILTCDKETGQFKINIDTLYKEDGEGIPQDIKPLIPSLLQEVTPTETIIEKETFQLEYSCTVPTP